MWNSKPRHTRWIVGVLLAFGLLGRPALCWPQETLAQLTKVSGGHISAVAPALGTLSAPNQSSKAKSLEAYDKPLVIDQVFAQSASLGTRVRDNKSWTMVLTQVAVASHRLKLISQVAPPPADPQEVSLSGWFSVIWNDKTRYFLTDDQGRWTELLLDEEMAKPLGGPLALNRRRVKILGVSVAAPPGAVRVLSIEFE